MEEYIAAGAVLLVGGAVAAWRFRPRKAVVVPAALVDHPTETHEHDWHIREKRLGKVIQYCLVCDTERERPEE